MDYFVGKAYLVLSVNKNEDLDMTIRKTRPKTPWRGIPVEIEVKLPKTAMTRRITIELPEDAGDVTISQDTADSIFVD